MLSSVTHTSDTHISGSSLEQSLATETDAKGLSTGEQHMYVSTPCCSHLTSLSSLDNTVYSVNTYQPATI